VIPRFFARRPLLLAGLVLCLLAAAFLLATRRGARPGPADPMARHAAPGERAMPVPEPTGVRLVLIGLDGADWAVVDPLMRQGRLPNLARLVATGARGNLRSYDPMISPLLWTTMVTGVGPDVHGVADFQAIDAATGRRIPITSRFRKIKALWNILGDAGLDSAFVAWWASYPAEQVRGFQVSNLVAFETVRQRPSGTPPPSGITFPPGYFAEIRPSLVSAADLTYEEVRAILHIDRSEFEKARREVLEPAAADPEAQNRKTAQLPVPLALSILTGSRNYATIGADLARRRLPLTAVYFEGIDMMGHRFQHCMPPRMAICPESDFSRYQNAVTAFYARQDELIGEILEAAGPDATVMVVSDHGFRTGASRPRDRLPFTTQQPVEWHREEGIMALSGPGVRPSPRLLARATLFDVAPTILYLLGMPVSREMTGHVLLEAIDPAFIRAHPVRAIASYESLGAPRQIAVSDGPAPDEAEEELLDSLRSLGYIGTDDPNTTTARDEGGAPAAGAGTQVFYHRNLATYFLKRKDYERAAVQLRLANERQKLPKTYQMLSEAYLGMGRKDEAIAALEEGLLSVEGTDPEAVLWLVQVRLSVSGGGEKAAAEASRHASRTAGRPGLDDAIAGLILEDRGNAPAAVERYRRSLEADPLRVVVAQRLFALLGLESGGAVLEPALRRALAKDPRIDEYHNMIGAILARRGRAGEALAAFQEAAQLDPDNPRFAANLASMLARLERWEEAATAYERAMAIEPSAALALQAGSVFRRLGRPERAFEEFERAKALGDAGVAPILGAALARSEMRQIPAALAVVREGLAVHPDDRSLRSLYEDLLRRAGQSAASPETAGPGR
jgi:tetratricopeptide (TPR) repeat protein